MKKLIFTILVSAGVAGSISSFAQPLSVGTTVNDITLTDIDGNEHSLYGYLDQGYTVLVDISATWCPPCWGYHETHVSDSLHAHYGPAGTVDPGKFITLFIEGELTNTTDQLHGIGTNPPTSYGDGTLGDWVTGVEYPIIDAANVSEFAHFLDPSANSISLPTFLLICPDRKVIWNEEGFSPSFSEAFFISQMGDCAPTSIGKIEEISSRSVYPNPVNDQLNLDVVMREKTDATIRIINIIGQEVFVQKLTLQEGAQTQAINTSGLQGGVYMLTITTPEGLTVQEKFVKQ